MRVLIARLSSLGDCVHTLPAAVALKRSFPNGRIVWLVDRRFAAIPSLCDAVDEVHLSDGRPWQTRTLGRFDLALDMQGLLKSALPIGFARADRKLGYHWRREGAWLFSQAVQPDPSSTHIVDQYVDVARAAGAEAHEAQFGLTPNPDDVAKFRTALGERKNPLVLCNAGAGWATKRWPPERFAELCDVLQTEGCDVGLLGAESERQLFEIINRPGAIDMVGRTNIRELVALISLADAHVGGDTGSTHIAAALGIPAIGLYSVTDPRRSGPYGQIARCIHRPDGLAEIGTEEVAERVLKAVAK